jgi:hypothetical protein
MCIPSRPAEPRQFIGGTPGTYGSYTSTPLKGRAAQAPAIAEPEKPDLGLTAAGNTIQKTMPLAGGIGTIESIQASAQSAENLTLDSPFGLDSQRVQRAKSRLSIAM